jgi:hypothetical protein
MSKKIFSYSVVGVDNLVAAWDRAGTDLPWVLETKRLDLGTKDMYKSVDKFQVNGENKYGVEVALELSETSDKDVEGEWLPSQTLGEETWIERDTIWIKTKLFGTGGTFTFGALSFHGEPGGMR